MALENLISSLIFSKLEKILFIFFRFSSLYFILFYIRGRYIELDKSNGFYNGDTKKHLEIRNDFCKLIS